MKNGADKSLRTVNGQEIQAKDRVYYQSQVRSVINGDRDGRKRWSLYQGGQPGYCYELKLMQPVFEDSIVFEVADQMRDPALKCARNEVSLDRLLISRELGKDDWVELNIKNDQFALERSRPLIHLSCHIEPNKFCNSSSLQAVLQYWLDNALPLIDPVYLEPFELPRIAPQTLKVLRPALDALKLDKEDLDAKHIFLCFSLSHEIETARRKLICNYMKAATLGHLQANRSLDAIANYGEECMKLSQNPSAANLMRSFAMNTQ